MESQALGKIADRWLTAQVELAAGETILFQRDMAYKRSWMLNPHRRLFLTTTRLIWIRWRAGFPIGPKVIQIELRDIKRCGTVRPAWLVRRHAFAIEAGAQPETLQFLPLRDGSEAEAWREVVAGALKTADAEADNRT